MAASSQYLTPLTTLAMARRTDDSVVWPLARLVSVWMLIIVQDKSGASVLQGETPVLRHNGRSEACIVGHDHCLSAMMDRDLLDARETALPSLSAVVRYTVSLLGKGLPFRYCAFAFFVSNSAARFCRYSCHSATIHRQTPADHNAPWIASP